MTDKEMRRLKDSLPRYEEMNEQEEQLDLELDCRDMINSILIYGGLDKDIETIYNDKYLRSYRPNIEKERLKQLIKEQQEDLKKSNIHGNVYTDGEGVSYNSVIWYDEINAKKEDKNESKDLNVVNVGDRVKIINANKYHDGKYGRVEYKDDEIVTVRLDNGLAFNYDYVQVIKESKELRKYNSRLYGIYDTKQEKYIKTGTLEEMQSEIEQEYNNLTGNEKLQNEKENNGININVTIKNESLDNKNRILSRVFSKYPDIDEEDEDYLTGLTLEELIDELKSRGWEDLLENKKMKIESFEEESIDPIINPEDRFYKDEHLWVVYLYPGAGVEMIPYYVYANYEQDALEILVPYLLDTAPSLVYDISELETEDLDNYITVNGIYYLDYNTRIEELLGKDKEQIENKFFGKYENFENKSGNIIYDIYIMEEVNGEYNSLQVDTVDSLEQAEDKVAELEAETGLNAYYKERLIEAKFKDK